MYLVCCPNHHIDSMIERLASIHITGIGLNLMDIEFDGNNLVFVEQNLNPTSGYWIKDQNKHKIYQYFTYLSIFLD